MNMVFLLNDIEENMMKRSIGNTDRYLFEAFLYRIMKKSQNIKNLKGVLLFKIFSLGNIRI